VRSVDAGASSSQRWELAGSDGWYDFVVLADSLTDAEAADRSAFTFDATPRSATGIARRTLRPSALRRSAR